MANPQVPKPGDRPAAATARTVALVYARQDDEPADALAAQLVSAGSVIVRRRITGLPGRTFQDEADPAIVGADRVVVVLTAWMQASDWAFSAEATQAIARGVAVVWQVEAVRFGGSPLAPLPAVAGAADAVVAALGEVGALQPAAHADVPPYATDRTARGLARAMCAERLEGLYAIRASRRGVRGLAGAVKRTAAELREGPRLEAGEFLADGAVRLLENIGHGAFGSVWRARDRETGQLVAVKVLHTQWVDDGDALDAFFESTRRMSTLSHPAVCSVVDAGGTESGFPFVITLFQPGGSLEAAVRTGATLGVARALQGVLDVGQGLEAAHAMGFVHGNIKPSNVLFGARGEAVVTDFDGGRVHPTEGTDALYTAPERMSEGAVGPTADVYSLAMTTLFALHGAPLPFWVLRDPERLVGGLAVGDAVKNALRAALDWEPTRRTPTVTAFVRGLLSDPEVVRLLSDSARQSGRFGVAADHLRALLDRAGGRPPALLLALGRTLLQAGDEPGAEAAFLEVLESGGDGSRVAEVITELERLAAQRGSWNELAGALRRRALAATLPAARPERAALLLGVARLVETRVGEDTAACRAWAEVLEHHTDRDQAVEALEHLVRRAEARGDWVATVGYGRHLLGFVAPDAQPALAWRLGVAAMDHLGDMPAALLWLQRAQDGGVRDEGLPHRLEAIRSARGEWRQVVALMLERAESLDDEEESIALLLRAARVALYAHNHHEDAAAILLRVLLRDPEHRAALRFLARHHARAGRDDRALALYARLAPHEERGREGEAVEVRVADNVDYARILLRNDRPRGAQLCLEAALDLNPTHVPTLALASQLSFDLGKWEEARVATEGIVRCFSAAERDAGQRADADVAQALCRLGDLAWLHGELQDASAHYHGALELHPDHLGAWWGKAKVAIAGNVGRLDPSRVREEPWLVAAPLRFTPHEALARLLSALLDRAAIEAWMRLDPMGPEVLRLLGDQPAVVLACAVVDVLVARELVRAELFRRLSTAFPAWAGAIEAVRCVWFDLPGASAFPLAEAQSWGAWSPDFDPSHHREVVHHDPPLPGNAPVSVRPSLAALHHASAWKKLLKRKEAPPPPRRIPRGTHGGEARQKARSAVLVIYPDSAEQRVLYLDEGAVVGGGPDDDLSLPLSTLEPGHVRFERVENWFYLRAVGPVEVEGARVVGRRLRGGERLRIGLADAIFQTFDADDPPDLTSGAPIQRPSIGEKPIDPWFDLGGPGRSGPKAAVFYSEEGSERMLPFVGDLLVINEGPDGELVALRDVSREFDVMLVHREGGYFIDENDTTFFHADGSSSALQPLKHGDEFVVGARLLQFRLLDKAHESTPIDDLTALWGTPEGVPILVYDDGTRHGRPIPLTTDEFTIGRGRTTDFQISVDASLSRVHCRLERRGTAVFVRDAGSSNGTRVNGVPADGQLRLQDGDTVEIGQTRMQFRSGATAPSVSPLVALQDYGTDDPTEVLPVGELSRKALPLDEGLDKIRVANRVLGIVLGALDEADGAGRGRAELQLMLEARPRAYQSLLDGIDVRDNGVPGLEVMYNLAQRSDQEQRPLLNFVLGDLIDRAVEQVCELLPDERIDGVLARVAETRHRDFLRF